MGWKKFREFENNADAELLIRLLDEHQVDYEVEQLPKLRLEEEHQFPVVIKLDEREIRRVNELLLSEKESELRFKAFDFFDDKDQASDLLNLLKKHNIPHIIGDSSSGVDTMYFNVPTPYYVMVQIRHFEKVKDLIAEDAQDLVQNLGPDYPLYQMNNQELLGILEHQDKWHLNDVLMAQRILGERGTQYSQKDVELMKQRRWIDLSQPKSVKPLYIGLAYLTSILGGLVGVIIGLRYFSSEGSDPDRQSFYIYDQMTRSHGKKIFILGIIVFVAVIVKMYFFNQN
ncbi:MAG: hypothetical protein GY810_10690 [Aureispira sp.]|nr:hypothetical protein [Aureispira sp.]